MFLILRLGLQLQSENLSVFNNKLFFTAKNNFSGLQIWSSGSTGGTEPPLVDRVNLATLLPMT